MATKKPPSLPAAKPAVPLPATESDVGDDAECCPICFEPWTNSGLHRLSSLRCGHLFGKSCIEKWLKSSVGKCPQCNAKAQRKDIRPLFARTLKTIDTSERDRALEQLEQEKEARRTAELDAARARLSHQMALNECTQLRQELERQRQQLEQFRQSVTPNVDGHSSTSAFDANRTSGRVLYTFEKQIRISETGGCRVLTYCHQRATLCISQPSSNPLFPGFGFKKLNALDFKSSEFVSIHTKAIRDLATNGRSTDATLLSGSMDKFVKLTSLHSNSTIQSFECAMPVWSCAWNVDDRNYFYAGLQNGSVSAFDTRNLSEPVFQLNHDAGSRSPIVSLQYLPIGHGTASRPGGLLVGQLDRSSFYERRNATDFRIHMLPLEASLTSLSLEEATGHILATYRPTARNPSVRHQVCELAVKPNASSGVSDAVTDVACNCVQVFHGGATQKLLTRSRLVLPPGPGGELLTCAGDEASLSVYVWNAGTGQLQQKLSTTDPVIDLCPLTVNSQPFLVALTEKQITIYRWKQPR